MQTRSIRLTFIEENVSATATLLWDRAPGICAKLIERLPLNGNSFHAMYSGSEIALEVPHLPKIELEHATTMMSPGEIAYVHLSAGEYYGVESDISEICWVYDIDGKPSMYEGAVPVSVFARLDDVPEFIAVCFRMRLEGQKELRIEGIAQ